MFNKSNVSCQKWAIQLDPNYCPYHLLPLQWLWVNSSKAIDYIDDKERQKRAFCFKADDQSKLSTVVLLCDGEIVRGSSEGSFIFHYVGIPIVNFSFGCGLESVKNSLVWFCWRMCITQLINNALFKLTAQILISILLYWFL